MPKGKVLSDYEKGVIDSLFNEGKNKTYISNKIKRSRKVVINYLQLKDKYNSFNSLKGAKQKISQRTKRYIFKLALVYKKSARQIKNELDQNISKSTIYNVLKNKENIKYATKIKRPFLNQNQINKRLKFAFDHQTWKKKWKNVIFSDEKKGI